MPTVELSNAVFKAAQQLAGRSGFASVDDYIADVVLHDGAEPAESVSHLCTPDRLARIDAGLADVRRGPSVTPDQAGAELASQRAEWIRANPR